MKRTKKALAVVLSLSMLASITPQIVLANSNIPDRYEEVRSVSYKEICMTVSTRRAVK